MPGSWTVRVIIVADGEVDATALGDAVDAPGVKRPLVIAADGGALRAESVGVIPDLLMGDGDSVSSDDVHRLRALGVEVRLVAAEKDESDTELCLREAFAQGARTIRIFGALGGPRPEHALANVALLALPESSDRDVSIEHGRSSLRLFGGSGDPASISVRGTPGDYLSLQPLAPGAEGVTTQGLRYPLCDEALPYGPSRGVSNEFVARDASITVTRGRLVVTHTRRLPSDRS